MVDLSIVFCKRLPGRFFFLLRQAKKESFVHWFFVHWEIRWMWSKIWIHSVTGWYPTISVYIYIWYVCMYIYIYDICWLVVWNMTFMTFPSYMGMENHPNWRFSSTDLWFTISKKRQEGRNWNHENSAINEIIFDVLLSFTIALFFGDVGCLVLPRQSEWLGSRFSTQGILNNLVGGFTMFHIPSGYGWHSHGIDGS